MKDKKGVALLLALYSLLIISLLVVAFLETTTIDLQIINNQASRNQALYNADAGVEYALSVLKNSRANFSQTVYFPENTSNTYSVTYVSDSGKITSGTIISSGSLVTGTAVTVETRVSIVGTSAPYSVKIISWKEI